MSAVSLFGSPRSGSAFTILTVSRLTVMTLPMSRREYSGSSGRFVRLLPHKTNIGFCGDPRLAGGPDSGLWPVMAIRSYRLHFRERHGDTEEIGRRRKDRRDPRLRPTAPPGQAGQVARDRPISSLIGKSKAKTHHRDTDVLLAVPSYEDVSCFFTADGFVWREAKFGEVDSGK
jgi:hypothetical protein